MTTDDDLGVSDHIWQFQTHRWVCARCGHAFDWIPSEDKNPQTFEVDGSPARGDPAWMRFQIVGLMSFTDACGTFTEAQQRKLVDLSGMKHGWGGKHRVGTHAVAFKHCLFEEQADGLLAVDEVMNE